MAKLVRGIFGVRDYKYATLEDIIDVLHDYEVHTHDATQELTSERLGVEQNQTIFKNPASIIRFIHHWTYIFESFEKEFIFLVYSLTQGIKQSHFDRIAIIYTVSHEENGSTCADFNAKHMQIEQRLPEANLTVERIYDIAQSQFIDYFDLSGLLARLKELFSQVPVLTTTPTTPASEVQPAKPKEGPPNTSFEVPKGTNWADVYLQFVGDYSLYIQVGSQVLGKYSFIELGFEDRRKANKDGKRYPNKQWKVLMLLNHTKGSISWMTPGVDSTYKKAISILRKDLRRLFPGIRDRDPFYRFEEKSKSYEAKFVLRPRPDDDD